jgi:hypothetical protein
MALYLVCLLIYSVVLTVKDWSGEYDLSHLGWTNGAIIGLTDTLLIAWGILSVKGIFLSPFKSSLFLLATRTMISFLPEYWIVVHSVVLSVLLVLFVTSWIWKNIEVETKRSKRARTNRNIMAAIAKTDSFKLHLIKAGHLTQARVDEFKDDGRKVAWWWKLVELIPSALLVAGFLVYACCVNYIDMDEDRRPKIESENTYEQGEFAWVALALIFTLTFMLLWFRLWQFCKYEFRWWLFVVMSCGYLAICCVGIIFTVANLSDVSLGSRMFLTTSFMGVPAYIFTMVLFASLFIKNKFQFYKPIALKRGD